MQQRRKLQRCYNREEGYNKGGKVGQCWWKRMLAQSGSGEDSCRSSRRK
ncbi:unnamed protein product, partial [Musa hybrid cultivar]